MENRRKKYQKPKVVFEEEIEAFAGTCTANPLSKTAVGEPNSFGRVCESGQLYS